jgi:hypothetical protein
MDQSEKLQRLTVVLAHSQIKLSSELKNLQRFMYGRTWKNILYIFLEVFFYILFALLLIIGFSIPSDPIAFEHAVGLKSSLSMSFHHDNITEFVILLKLLLIFCSLGFLLAALFSRKARRRGYLIGKTAQQIKSVSEEMAGVTSIFNG